MRKESRKLIYLSALAGLLLLSGTGDYLSAKGNAAAAQSTPPTPASVLLNTLIDAINSGDAKTIAAFVNGNFTDAMLKAQGADKISRTFFNVAKRSSGLVIDSINPGNTGVNAVIHTKASGKNIYLSLDVASQAPAKIGRYEIIVMPPPIGDFLPETPPPSMDKRLEIAKLAMDKACAQEVFSGSVMVSRSGKVIFSHACGEANRGLRVANTPEKRFGIASVGKLFTAVAAAQLVSQGKLSYDEPIIRYLPHYPNKKVASEITLRELLTHSSGLGDFFAKPAPQARLRHLKDYYPLFVNDPLLFEPGKGNTYSNTGFLVASMIVEQVSRQEFRHYLRKHIFAPAGMLNTDWRESRRVAQPYVRDNADDPLATDSPWIVPSTFYSDLVAGPEAGAGGEYSTTGDLLKFADALQRGKLLDVKALDRMIQQGLGCQCFAKPGQRIFAHPGGGPGVDAGLKIDVDDAFAVSVLSNYSPPFPRILAGAIGDLLAKP